MCDVSRNLFPMSDCVNLKSTLMSMWGSKIVVNFTWANSPTSAFLARLSTCSLRVDGWYDGEWGPHAFSEFCLGVVTPIIPPSKFATGWWRSNGLGPLPFIVLVQYSLNHNQYNHKHLAHLWLLTRSAVPRQDLLNRLSWPIAEMPNTYALWSVAKCTTRY